MHLKDEMATQQDDDFNNNNSNAASNKQIWSQYLVDVADLSSTYNLYQRRYPRRLPKLNDYPSRIDSELSQTQSPSRVSTPLDEAFPAVSSTVTPMMTPKNKFFGKREVFKTEVHSEVTNLTLEDYQEDEAAAGTKTDIELQMPSTSNKSKKDSLTVAFNLNNNKLSDKKFDQESTSLRNGHNSPLPSRSTVRSRGSLSKSPPILKGQGRVGRYSIDIGSVRKRGSFPAVQSRSNSVSEPRSLVGRRSPSPICSLKGLPRPCSKISPPKDNFELFSKLNSHKETSSIQNLVKNKDKSRTKFSPALITKTRRHTIHSSLISENPRYRKNKVNGETQAEAIDSIEKKIETIPPPPILPTKITVQKPVDKSSREYFFSNCLELDSEMELLENRNHELPPKRIGIQEIRGLPITSQIAYTLRMLLFGSSSTSFTEVWRNQILSYLQPNFYALRFHKDSPVEIMVSLQAYILKRLLFININQNFDPNVTLSPDDILQKKLLIFSIADMLWDVGMKEHCVIALPLGECNFIAKYCYRNDEVTEKMELFKFTKVSEVQQFVRENIHRFQNAGCHGCISLLYSLMLTRGLSNILDDCSEMKHGILEYDASQKSQPLINLCINGKAVPNIFNKDLEFYNEIKEEMEIQKGIDKRCDIGFLSHAEFDKKKKYEVGSCLKTPRYPIWIMNNNGTLAVLFSVKRELLSDWKLERRFDVYYYQGVARHVPTSEVDIRLTIDTIQTLPQKMYEEEEENSTLEETLRTKWTDSVIEWNGYTRF